MGKFELQSLPLQKPESDFVCAHSTRKNSYFNRVEAYRHHHHHHHQNVLTNGMRRMSLTAENGPRSGVGLRDVDEEEDGGVLPQGTQVFTNQVAGHIIGNSGGIGMLKKEGLALKPLLKSECGEREVKLYEQLEGAVDGCLIEMRKLAPKYHGVQKLEVKGTQIDFLVLEDLTRDFKEPCIMDVKIGRRTWDPTASYDKIIAEDQKYQACKRDLGFCVPGFQVYRLADGRLVKYDKEYGKGLDKDGAREAVKIFLNADAHQHFCRKLLVQFLASLWRIQHFARNQRRLRLYATSILLVYDARRLREHAARRKPKGRGPPLVRHRSLYRPLSLARLNDGCEMARTGFSGQLTPDGPILRATCKKVPTDHLDERVPTRIVNNDNAWRKSIRALKRTHSFQNNYDQDVQNRKQNYTSMLDDLCYDSKSEVWAAAKLIDFAHVYPSDSVDVDKNYLEGVENLVKMFEDFLAETED